VKTKKCNQCEEVKLKTEFSPRKDSKDGLHCICRICRLKNNREYQRKYCLKNKNKVKVYRKAWREKNKKKIREYRKIYAKKKFNKNKGI